jgi:hypothetical protein
VVVLWRYFHDRRPIAPLAAPGTPWIDFLTVQDPVMNRRRKGLLPPSTDQRRVQNRGSILSDHSAYWKNSDQFVPQVAQEVGRLDEHRDQHLDLMAQGPVGSDAAANSLIVDASKRRRGRVAALRRRRIAVIIATAVVLGLMLWLGQLVEIGEPVYDLVTSLPKILTDWVPDIVFAILPIRGNEKAVLGALLVVASIAVATALGSQLWNRWSTRDTTQEFQGKRVDAAAVSGPQVAFYAWSLLQLVLPFVVIVFGPTLIATRLGEWQAKSNEIAAAWASAYVWTLIVGFVAFAWASTLNTPEPVQSPPATPATSPITTPSGWRSLLASIFGSSTQSDWKFRIIGGISLALSIELILALIFPIERPIAASLAFGIVVGVAAVLLMWIIWAALRWVVARISTKVEDETEKEKADHVATVLDYLGCIGFLLACVASLLAAFGFGFLSLNIEDYPRLWFASAFIAVVAAIFGLALLKYAGGIQKPTSRVGRWVLRTRPITWLKKRATVGRAWLAAQRMTKREDDVRTLRIMKLVGALTMLIALVAFSAAVYGAASGPHVG